MGHKATEAQLKIFDFVKNGKGNGIIDAVAGAGKTSTLMGCVMHIPNLDDVIYCAFNTSIRKELQKKFKAAKKNVKVNLKGISLKLQLVIQIVLKQMM